MDALVSSSLAGIEHGRCRQRPRVSLPRKDRARPPKPPPPNSLSSRRCCSLGATTTVAAARSLTLASQPLLLSSASRAPSPLCHRAKRQWPRVSSLAEMERCHCCFPRQPRSPPSFAEQSERPPLSREEGAAVASHPSLSRKWSVATDASLSSRAPSPLCLREKQQWPRAFLPQGDGALPLLLPLEVSLYPHCRRAKR